VLTLFLPAGTSAVIVSLATDPLGIGMNGIGWKQILGCGGGDDCGGGGCLGWGKPESKDLTTQPHEGNEGHERIRIIHCHEISLKGLLVWKPDATNYF